MSYCEMVREFTKATNPDIPNKPKMFTTEAISFLRDMLTEELEEMMWAGDLVGQADALADAIYFICDAACKHGINLDDIMESVHEANMRKIVAGMYVKNDAGKVLKPQCWVGPEDDIKDDLNYQERTGAFNG